MGRSIEAKSSTPKLHPEQRFLPVSSPMPSEFAQNTIPLTAKKQPDQRYKHIPVDIIYELYEHQGMNFQEVSDWIKNMKITDRDGHPLTVSPMGAWGAYRREIGEPRHKGQQEGKPRHMPQDPQKQEAAHLYENGVTTDAIARRFNLRVRTARQWIKRGRKLENATEKKTRTRQRFDSSNASTDK